MVTLAQNYPSATLGGLFSCAGMSIFLGMIVYTEVRLIVTTVYAAALETAEFATHDTGVFPDYTHENNE